jgi:undecaprenyl-diphosphatase
MSWIHILILAFVQGMTELLPVSSSAHVIVIAELLHENMSTPANALLLVMLHTGTMFAVIVYFWRRWVREFLSSWSKFYRFAKLIFVACLLSGVVFLPIRSLVVHILSHGNYHASIETLFHKLNWIAPALFIVGLVILYAGLREARKPASDKVSVPKGISWRDSIVMGILQGFAIPFRGFSRSGSTISGGLLTGGNRDEIESFSFAMGVAITPLAIGWLLLRDLRAIHRAGLTIHLGTILAPGLFGMACAFVAGLLALLWLSRWLEHGRWYWFGIYCLVASVTVEILYLHGW